jgi:hypothetical protein
VLGLTHCWALKSRPLLSGEPRFSSIKFTPCLSRSFNSGWRLVSSNPLHITRIFLHCNELQSYYQLSFTKQGIDDHRPRISRPKGCRHPHHQLDRWYFKPTGTVCNIFPLHFPTSLTFDRDFLMELSMKSWVSPENPQYSTGRISQHLSTVEPAMSGLRAEVDTQTEISENCPVHLPSPL